MKLNKLLFVSMWFVLPVFAAEGDPGVTTANDGAKLLYGAAQREACKSDPEKCRQEQRARADAHFKKTDADGNGSLSLAEGEKGMSRLVRHFDRIDANKDGQLSREEMAAARKAHQGAKRPVRS